MRALLFALLALTLAACQSLPASKSTPVVSARSKPVTTVKPPSSVLPSSPAVAPVPAAQPPVATAPAVTAPPRPVLPSGPLLVRPQGAAPGHRLADGRDMPAVQGLLASAASALQQGRLEDAASSLERAQRLAPQSAAVYLKLAETRLRQGRSIEAEHLARKGLAYTASPVQQAAFWRLIATAAEQQGRFDTAQQAREKAQQLEAEGERS